MIAIVDYGVGNLGSIVNMIRRIDRRVHVTRAPADILSADHIILPGVGAFDAGMRNLREAGLEPPLREAVMDRKIPLLGICLGMQLLARRSDEGTLDGLGWIDAHVRRFESTPQAPIKVPHMGWNDVTVVRDNPLFVAANGPSRFYFVHAYHVVCQDPADVVGRTTHGIEFTSVVHRANIFGTQFHPEKSHKFGFHLLRSFLSVHA